MNGRGPITGSSLVSHPGVDRISFTGGTVTGRRVMMDAGKQLTPCTMELGGKSANIIFASADYQRAIDGALIRRIFQITDNSVWLGLEFL